ncbi:transcription initiation factor TFIID TATA-box-binding protein [Paragonimus westermani]|uniref:Transcription initiation factor TFIID TATA-box-binding protein n=1 Tax=Paragonimus westermani TaxID=34504 RepID=A0A5J4P1Z9_9TREM|nr:transcription initiation factor TFIID TATA-box-binding protein [Paragonimus westermani]
MSGEQPTTMDVTVTPLRPVAPDVGSTGLMYGLRSPMIHNVIATVNLGCPIELRKVVLHIRSAEYNPKRFPGAVVRLREPRVTCLVFSTGKMVCTGARSETDCNLGARKCARILQKIGFPVGLNSGYFSGYEPEIFPGLIYRIVKPRMAMLIFVNGKIVMTGCKSREQMHEALNSVYPVLYNYRKTN